MTRSRLVISWLLLIGSTVGEGVTTTLWLLNRISTRTLVGVTLVLSWLALQFSAFNALQIAVDRRHQDES